MGPFPGHNELMFGDGPYPPRPSMEPFNFFNDYYEHPESSITVKPKDTGNGQSRATAVSSGRDTRSRGQSSPIKESTFVAQSRTPSRSSHSNDSASTPEGSYVRMRPQADDAGRQRIHYVGEGSRPRKVRVQLPESSTTHSPATSATEQTPASPRRQVQIPRGRFAPARRTEGEVAKTSRGRTTRRIDMHDEDEGYEGSVD